MVRIRPPKLTIKGIIKVIVIGSIMMCTPRRDREPVSRELSHFGRISIYILTGTLPPPVSGRTDQGGPVRKETLSLPPIRRFSYLHGKLQIWNYLDLKHVCIIFKIPALWWSVAPQIVIQSEVSPQSQVTASLRRSGKYFCKRVRW